MTDKYKVRVSTFVADILENDALRFGFLKNGKSNKNALLNKLIPVLLATRKERRSKIEEILKNEYARKDSEKIYSAVNTVIDRVYFNDENLNELEDIIWIRPSKETYCVYDEIKTSEALITAQEVPVYIRGLLNEYACLPQYKRELLTFDAEMEIFSEACDSHQILHFKDKETDERYKAFAFHYYYGHLCDQTNFCVIFDISKKQIRAIPLSKIKDAYTIKQKYKPSDYLLTQLQSYANNRLYDQSAVVEVKEDVL